MAEGGLRGHGELPLAADINVTSLVDVAFVLLIIMLTAPIMQGGVDVRLPQTEARALRPDEAAVVSINPEGGVSLNGAVLPIGDLRPALEAVVADEGPPIVYVRADARVDYGQVAQVLADIRAAGVPNLALVSERVVP